MHASKKILGPLTPPTLSTHIWRSTGKRDPQGTLVYLRVVSTYLYHHHPQTNDILSQWARKFPSLQSCVYHRMAGKVYDTWLPDAELLCKSQLLFEWWISVNSSEHSLFVELQEVDLLNCNRITWTHITFAMLQVLTCYTLISHFHLLYTSCIRSFPYYLYLKYTPNIHSRL